MALRVKINPEKIPNRDQPLSIHKLNVVRSGAPVLKDVSFEVGQGEILGIVGPNGSGKTTLTTCIAGTLDVPNSSIECSHALHDGNDLFSLSTQQRYRSGVHCVFEGRRLFSDLTVRENLSIALSSSSKKEVTSRLNDLVELFPKLSGLMDKKAKHCSGGQQQVVAIARAIMDYPSVLVLDEPTLGLAPTAIEAIASVLRILVSGSVGVLVLEQREGFISSVADRRLNLFDGKLSEPLAGAGRAVEWKPK